MKNLNKINRHTIASHHWDKVHMPNNIEYDPKRKGGVLDHFVTTYGIHKKAENFNRRYSYGINNARCLFDSTACFTED